MARVKYGTINSYIYERKFALCVQAIRLNQLSKGTVWKVEEEESISSEVGGHGSQTIQIKSRTSDSSSSQSEGVVRKNAQMHMKNSKEFSISYSRYTLDIVLDYVIIIMISFQLKIVYIEKFRIQKKFKYNTQPTRDDSLDERNKRNNRNHGVNVGLKMDKEYVDCQGSMR